MIKISPFILLFSFIFIFNCSNPTCREDVTGTFNGKCTSSLNNAKFDGPIIITLFETNESTVIIQDQTLGSGEETYEGRLTNDCTRINIPSQSFVSANQLPFGISGFFEIEGDNLSGELEVQVGVSASICTYEMTRE